MLRYIDINRIFPHAKNPRIDLGDLTELAESIKITGILQNLTIVPQDMEWWNELDDECKSEYHGNFTVIIGHRRTAAAQIAGLTVVPCIISIMDENTQVATMLLENMQRSDLTPYEEAQGIQLMLDFGETVFTISKKTGLSETTVRKRKKLLTLDKDKLKQAEERGATLADFVELDKIHSSELKHRVLDTIGTSNFRHSLQKAVEEETLTKMKADILEKLSGIAVMVESLWGYATVKVLYHSQHHYNNFEIPEDADTVDYYYCIDGDYIRLLVKRHEAVASVQVENNQAEEECKARVDALDKACNQAYHLRLDFAKKVDRNSKGQDIIERMAAFCIIKSYGYVRTDVFHDFFDINKPFKPDYNAKSDDTGETFREACDRVISEGGYSSTKLLVAGVYMRLEDKDRRFHNSKGIFVGDALLDRLYGFLCSLGYEMSDEEKALQDGTHELYTEDVRMPVGEKE